MGGKYNVVLDRGTYIGVQNHDGKLSCSFLGFLRKEKGSHSTVLSLKTKPFGKRRSRISKK